MTMDMLQIFHMNGGEGETSYAKNCTIQAKILSITKACVEAAMQDYHRSCHFPRDTLTIAELGCSSGSTALATVNQIIDIVEARGGGEGRTKFLVYMNDLPRNDFNELFTLLPSFQKKLKQERGADFGPCYIAGLPGNFYERLVPNQTLHFVHSSSSLHWLSQAPQGLDGKDDPRTINKGKLYISMDSPRPVIDAYSIQFRKDFTSFLKCRSEEMVLGGRLVLSFVGRRSILPTRDEDFFPWEFIAQALMSMVSEGLVKEELVDSFNVPYYAPCLEEVKTLIEENSSFYGDRFETAEIEWDGGAEIESKSDSSKPRLTKGGKISKLHRAVVESLLEHYFGGEIMDELFLRYAKTLDDVLSSGSKDYTLTNLVVSLIRL